MTQADYGGLRIMCSADNLWRDALEQAGAVQVSKAEYERADALEGEE